MIRHCILALAAASLVTGCVGSRQSSQPASTASQEVRSSVVTAPADLQLFCASTAAQQFGVASSDVLPIASESIGGGQYTVRLQIPGGRANCLIDDEANVSSIVRA